MSELNTLRDGLIDQLKDLFSAENQLLKALPKLEKKATNPKLKKAFGSHLLETQGQVSRLEQIAKLMNEKLTGKTCKAMQGLIEEGKEVLEEESENDALIDTLLIGAAQRVEHYEIAAYGTARAMAEEIGETAVVRFLQASLDEECAADEKLTEISEGQVLSEACAFSESEEEEEEDSPKRPTPTKKKTGNASRFVAVVGSLLLAHHLSANTFAENNAVKAQNERQALNFDADNTGRNVRDNNDSRVTADDQNLRGTDLEVLARARKEIVANENLSTNGQNVKVLIENGKLMLRGPVKSAAEKAMIEQAVNRAAPGISVVNHLEVSPG